MMLSADGVMPFNVDGVMLLTKLFCSPCLRVLCGMLDSRVGAAAAGWCRLCNLQRAEGGEVFSGPGRVKFADESNHLLVP